MFTGSSQFTGNRGDLFMKRAPKALLLGAALGLSVWIGGCGGNAAGTDSFGESDLPGGGIRIPHNERLHLSTDQRWVHSEGHLSDLIRLQWTADRAKPAIAWVDEHGNDKTAIVSHDKANNPEQHDHKHISIETTMSPDGEYAGQLFTRLEIPYDTDVSEIRTHSANFNVMSGYLRVAGEAESNRVLQFANSFGDNEVSPRWGIRADSAGESGDNAGSNFRIDRYADDGEVVDSPLFIERSTGHVGLGAQDPANRLDVDDDRIRIRSPHTPGSSNASCSQGQLAWDERYLYVCVADNHWKRAELADW